MKLVVTDFHTSFYDSQYQSKSSKTFLSPEQSNLYKRVSKNYQKLNIKSLLTICGNNNTYQTFVLCTQAFIALCNFIEISNEENNPCDK